MADLSELFKYSPEVAGYMTGQRQTSDLAYQGAQTSQLNEIVRDLQQKYGQNEAMNPLLLEQQRLANQETGARIPGIAATSRKLGTDADFEQQTLPGKVKATNSTNDETVVANQGKKLQEMGTWFRALGDHIGTVNDQPGAKTAVIQQALQAANIGPDHPMAQMLSAELSSVPPSQMAAKLKKLGDDIIHASPKYIEEMDKQKEVSRSHLLGIDKTVQGQKDVEQMRIDAGKYNSKVLKTTVESQLMKAPNAKAKAEVLEQAYAAAAWDDPMKQVYAQRAQEARQRAAEDAGNLGLARPGVDAPALAGVPATARPAATAPIAGAAAPAASEAQVGPPPAAAAHLKANPGMRAAFDQKYGAGAAAKVLGK